MADDNRISDLLLCWEERQERGQTVSAEELCQQCPELLPELKRRIDVLQSMKYMFDTRWQNNTDDIAGFATESKTIDFACRHPSGISTRADYRALRFHAHGGRGEIFVAEDERMHRQVAVKCIKRPYSDDPETRNRFLREARITCRLEHPGVVPVYGIGQGDNGHPFYCMRLIQGETLREAIQSFHASHQSHRNTAEDRWRLPQLLNRFVAVCNTIAYAHNRGILHRDIKPENILLGKYGETLVVDWGLAKSRDESTSDANESEEILAWNADDVTHDTVVGTAMGTPAYMSPEQASGRLDLLGPASDIFSLGATLYSLLTGRPPFLGRKIDRVVERVKRDEFPPPRQVNRRIHPALERICLKALAAKPEDRYETALDLAADLDHWSADEPVSAYPEPWTARVARWGRRHKPSVAGAAVLLITAVVALSISTVVISRQKRQTEQARALYEESYGEAKQAVDNFYTKVSESKLLNAPGAKALRLELLDDALAYYQKWVRQRTDDPSVQVQMARTYYRIGKIHSELGSNAEAISAFQQTREICQQCLRDDSTNAQLRMRLAGAYAGLGIVHREQGKMDKALRFHLQALEIKEEVVRDHPQNRSYQISLAKAHNNNSVVFAQSGDHIGAIESLNQALRIQSQLHRRFPSNTEYLQTLAVMHDNLGQQQMLSGNLIDALRSHQQAREIFERRLSDKTAGMNWRRNAAKCFQNLVNIRQMRGERKESLQSAQQARDLLQRLSGENPRVPQFRNDLAAVHLTLGGMYQATNRPNRALDSYQQAAEMFDQIVKNNPAMIEFQYNLAACFHNMTLLLTKEGKVSEALRRCTQSRDIYRGILKSLPADIQVKNSLAMVTSQFGNIHFADDRHHEALGHYEQACKLLEELIQQSPENPELFSELGMNWRNRGLALKKMDRFSEAASVLKTAIEHHRKAFDTSRDESKYRQRLDQVYLSLVDVYWKLKQPALAAQVVLERKKLWPNDPSQLYDTACQFALCIGFVAEGKSQLTPEETAERAKYTDQAIQSVQAAVKAGFQDFRRMRNDKYLRAIQDDPRFQTLLHH